MPSEPGTAGTLRTEMPLTRTLAAVGTLAVLATPLRADVAFVDSQGREWRELTGTTGRTWLAVAGACPTDGVTPCAGALGSLSVDGWVWATREQVQGMLAEFAAAIASEPCLSGGQYASAAAEVLWRFGSFPVFDFTNMVSGLTATSGTGSLPSSYAYAPSIQTNDKSDSSTLICATSPVPKTSSDSSCGIWLFRLPQCPADLNSDGTVDGADLGALLAGWGACSGAPCAADLNRSGSVDGTDLGALLAAWGGCG
jgi:hypothetical protein